MEIGRVHYHENFLISVRLSNTSILCNQKLNDSLLTVTTLEGFAGAPLSKQVSKSFGSTLNAGHLQEAFKVWQNQLSYMPLKIEHRYQILFNRECPLGKCFIYGMAK